MKSSAVFSVPGVRMMCPAFASIVGLVCFAAMSPADAAVIALDFPTTYGPVSTSTGGAIHVLSSDSTYGWISYAVNPGQTWIQFYDVYAQAPGPVVEFLPYGTEFGPADDGHLGWSYLFYASGSSLSTSDGYMAFKTATGYYGYADVSWDLEDTTLIFHSAYLESEQGVGITIGAVPEPATTSLGLLGIGGFLVRRRRA